jgi:Conserved TM helix
MDTLTRLLDATTAALGPFVPRVLGALTIVLVAWLAARVVRAAALQAGTKFRVDERLHSPGLMLTLAGVASALVWLLALPALLGTLELQGLLTPVNAMLSGLMGFVPNLFGALVVLAVGMLIANIVRQILSGVLRAAGSEKIADRLGLGTALGKDGLAGIAGNAAYALLLLPTLVAALQPLGLDAVTQPLSRLLETVISLIPKLLSAAILVGVAALIGRALSSIITALLASVGLDSLPQRLGAAPLRLAGRSLPEVGGLAVMVAVVMVAITQASEILGLPVLTQMLSALGAALVRLSVALVILIVGLILASMAVQAITQRAPRNAQLLGWAARAAILFFAAALALHQAGLPAEIVTIAFGAVVGGIAIGLAVAIGVGGRHVAARVLDKVAASFEAAPPAAKAAPELTQPD